MLDQQPSSFEAFEREARQGNVVPVVRSVLADLHTPVGAFMRIAGDAPYSFLLESVEGGERRGLGICSPAQGAAAAVGDIDGAELAANKSLAAVAGRQVGTRRDRNVDRATVQGKRGDGVAGIRGKGRQSTGGH